MPRHLRRTLFPFGSDVHGTRFADLVTRLAGALSTPLAAPAPDPESAAEDGPSRFTRLQVLVADDNPAHLGNACELLGHFGVVPVLAADGAEAVALACGHDFDVILMDLQMPVLDGLAATRQIRRFEHEQSAARATILAFTSRALDGDVARHCGFDGVLEEPCTLHTLQECLLRWAPLPGHRPATPPIRPADGGRSSARC